MSNDADLGREAGRHASQRMPASGVGVLESTAPYDIYARVFRFGVRIIRFVRTFRSTIEAREVGGQLVRSGTSIGANMEEANRASSRKEFVYRVRVARKEAREARIWLRLCAATEIGETNEARELSAEADEIVRVLSGIITATEAKP